MISIEQARKEVFDVGYVPKFNSYTNTLEKLDIEDVNGYKYKVCLKLLRKGCGLKLSIVSPSNPYSIYNINKWLKDNNKGYKVIDDVYKNNNCRLTCQCLKDGFQWKKQWRNIRNSVAICKKCKQENRTSWAKREVLKMGYKPLFKTYEGSESRLLMIDSNGYKVYSTMYLLKKNYGTNIVSSHNEYSIENIKRWLLLNSKKIELISKKYKSTHSPLRFVCQVDGTEWNASWASLQGGHGCPKCARKKSKGFFNKKRAEKYKEKWSKERCDVYIIRCFNESESFYKIGITKDIKQRFKKSRMPYKYEVINIIETNLYDAVHIESYLHKKNEINEYYPMIYFQGHTECFSNVIY